MSKKEVISAVNFEKCDFSGDFSDFKPSFKKCRFDKCDFGLTSWRRARFKGCEFHRCSLSLSSFEYCEFRDCKFSEISFSGNETILTNTLVNNPECFIRAGYTNLNEEDIKNFASGENADYQRMRLEGTKATVAREIMSNLSAAGDENSYYEAVRIYQNTSADYKIMKSKHILSKKPGLHVAAGAIFNLYIYQTEKLIINLAGYINNWGASVARPMFIGVLLVLLFTCIYYMTGLKQNLLKSLVAGIDVTFLVGYTKHASNADFSRIQILYSVNMLLGLVWYSIFIPTVINRISRVR